MKSNPDVTFFIMGALFILGLILGIKAGQQIQREEIIMSFCKSKNQIYVEIKPDQFCLDGKILTKIDWIKNSKVKGK